jgi:hypothetical protein
MRGFEPRHEDLGVEPPLDLLGRRVLEKELDRLLEIDRGLLDRRPLPSR